MFSWDVRLENDIVLSGHSGSYTTMAFRSLGGDDATAEGPARSVKVVMIKRQHHTVMRHLPVMVG